MECFTILKKWEFKSFKKNTMINFNVCIIFENQVFFYFPVRDKFPQIFTLLYSNSLLLLYKYTVIYYMYCYNIYILIDNIEISGGENMSVTIAFLPQPRNKSHFLWLVLQLAFSIVCTVHLSYMWKDTGWRRWFSCFWNG